MGIVSITELTTGQTNVNATEINQLVTPLLSEFNGSIENANVKSDAAIAYSKLSLGGKVKNADVKSDAAIDGSKISPDFGAQNVATTGELSIGGEASFDDAIIVSGAVSIGGALTVTDQTNIAQVVYTQDGAVATGSTAIPFDDSIPTYAEGTEIMTRTITPKSATNLLKIDVVVFSSDDTNSGMTVVTLFKDGSGTDAAIAAGIASQGESAALLSCTKFTHYVTAGGTSEITFNVRGGSDAGTWTFNGQGGGRYFGGIMASSITITEIIV